MKNKAKKVFNSEIDQKIMLEQSLRSYGYILPQTEKEMEKLDEIIGSNESPLPDSLMDTSFLFPEKKKRSAKVIPLYFETQSTYREAYAAKADQTPINKGKKKLIKKNIKKNKSKK